jgi:hypothetical protein
MSSLKALSRACLFGKEVEVSLRKHYSACMPFGFQPRAFSVSGADLSANSPFFTENEFCSASGVAGGGDFLYLNGTPVGGRSGFFNVDKPFIIHSQKNG